MSETHGGPALASLEDRLRHEECDATCKQPCEVMFDLRYEAADEIERLRNVLVYVSLDLTVPRDIREVAEKVLGARSTESRYQGGEMTKERETVHMTDDEGRVTGIGCRLDQSQCDHDFIEQGELDEGMCTKCGTSIWAYAFMECP